MPHAHDLPLHSALALALSAAALVTGCSGEETLPFGPTTTATGSGAQGGGGWGGGGAVGGAGGEAGGAGGGTGGSGGTPIECPADALVPGEHQLGISFDGHDREYEVQVPLSYDNSVAVPLVFDIHGLSSNKDQQQLVSGFQAKAEDEGFVVVRPNGYGLLSRSWNGGDFCCGAAQDEGLDDVGLMKAIVQEVSAQVCVDPKRIYATGISNGGALSHRIACEAADVFAAVAPVSYPLDFDPFDQCQPSRPIAVIHQHGTNDLLVPYGGGLTSPPTPDSFAYWGQADGCTGSPAVTYQNGDSYCETYETCSAGVNVTLCTINGGHLLYVNADGVPVADLAWQFLSRFTLP